MILSMGNSFYLANLAIGKKYHYPKDSIIVAYILLMQYIYSKLLILWCNAAINAATVLPTHTHN